jgi:hypothetical protein
MLVVGADRAVAADGRPLTELPVTQVQAIESFPEDDARGARMAARPDPGCPRSGDPAGASRSSRASVGES